MKIGENIRPRSEDRYAKEIKMAQSNIVTAMVPQLTKPGKKDLSNFRK